EGALKRQQDIFKQDIGLELAENVTVDTRFDYQTLAIDEERAITQALKNRSEIREQELETRLAELNVKEIDSRSDFRLDVTAFLDITGVSDPGLNDAGLSDLIESSFDDIGRRPRNKGVTLNVTVPLWDWGVNGNEVAQAQETLDEAALTLAEQKKTVTREVRAVISRVLETQGRLEVLKRSEEIAQKSYDISLARFENGDITSQELALDRDRLTAARTDYLNAYIAYQVAVADLKRKTLWDFEKNRSLVGE
ncbi:MAG: TolC family protein, partial [bacterium]